MRDLRRRRAERAGPRPGTEGARTSGVRAVRRGPLTTRAAVLGLVACAVAVTLAYPMRTLLAQRGEISHVRADQARQQQRVDALAAEEQRWQDPAYIEEQARLRLHYARPGDKTYIVVPSQGTGDDATPPSGQGTPSTPAGTPLVPASGDAWWMALWRATEAAGTGP